MPPLLSVPLQKLSSSSRWRGAVCTYETHNLRVSSCDLDGLGFPWEADFQLTAESLHQDSHCPWMTTGPQLVYSVCIGSILSGCLFLWFLCSTPGSWRPHGVSGPFRVQSKIRLQGKSGFKVWFPQGIGTRLGHLLVWTPWRSGLWPSSPRKNLESGSLAGHTPWNCYRSAVRGLGTPDIVWAEVTGSDFKRRKGKESENETGK